MSHCQNSHMKFPFRNKMKHCPCCPNNWPYMLQKDPLKLKTGGFVDIKTLKRE